MEGQSGDCPFLGNGVSFDHVLTPQWRGSRETARSVGNVETWRPAR